MAFKTGTAGKDTLKGTSGDDTLSGLAGDDTLIGLAGDDFMFGGEDNDMLEGGRGEDTYAHNGSMLDGIDTVVTGDNNRDIVLFTGTDLDNIQFRRVGNDLHVGALKGANQFDGKVIVKNHFAGQAVREVVMDVVDNLSWGTNFFESSFHFTTKLNSGINNSNDTEIILGTAAADMINGNDGFYDYLFGNAGNDTINGGAGEDGLRGGSGDDKLFGGASSDTLVGGRGDDRLDGGAGRDEADYDEEPTKRGVKLDLAKGIATEDGTGGTDKLISIEDAEGTRFADILKGNGANNALQGEAGNDKLYGRGGQDFLEGEEGNDRLDGGAGDDLLEGGSGKDTLLGGIGGDDIVGGDGNDALSGGAGNDTLEGEDGDDVLNGGSGDDNLDGGAGTDSMTGGLGGDNFVLDTINGANTVVDYTAAQGDTLDLSLDLAIPGTPNDLDDFIIFTVNGSNLDVSVDTDGTGVGATPTVVGTLTGITSANGIIVQIDASFFETDGAGNWTQL